MIQFFIYLLKASLGLVFAHLVYRFFLRKHTKFQINRFFLLLFIGLSLCLPLMEFSIDISPHTALAQGITYVENLDMGWEETELAEAIISPKEKEVEKGVNILVLLSLCYITGFIIYSSPILLSWKKLINLIIESPKDRQGDFTWIESSGSQSFSAFRYIFLGKELNSLSKADQEQIIQHEKVHAKGWHSLDLIFIDLIRMLFWFHPLKNILKKDLQELHECIADAQVTHEDNKHQYSRLIIQLAYDPGQNRTRRLPIHPFAYSPIKHRIAMLLKKPTSSSKYLILPSLCAFLFIIFMACTFEKSKVEEMITSKESFKKVQEAELEKVMDGIDLLQTEVEKVVLQDPKEFIYPIDSRVISGFGMRTHPVLQVKKMHSGIDFLAKMGTPIRAVADGKISLINEQKGGYGIQVEVSHWESGFVSKSAHLSEVKVKMGQDVKQGDIIALSGNSGKSKAPHLHFELKKDGKRLDPEKYLKR